MEKIKDPNQVSYYTNRANCYLKLENYTFAIQDSRKALELDPNWLKAHYFLSQSLMALQHYSEAVQVLKKAIHLSTSSSSSSHFTKELTLLFRMAKRQQWNVMNASRVEKESELFHYFKELVQNKIYSSQNEQEKSKSKDCIDQLSLILQELQEYRNPRIPDAFLDKISLQVMLDPWISPSGISYDKFEIQSHLNQIGSFDPLTREPLAEEDLIPNLALKELIQEFTDKYGKAFDE